MAYTFVTVGDRLTGKHDTFGLTANFWGDLLEMASIYGWHPAAPLRRQLLPESTVVGVSAEDARGLSAAIRKALPDIPDHVSVAFTNRPELAQPAELAVNPVNYLLGRENPPFTERFGGWRKRWLTEFAAFCEQGAFRVS